MEHIANVVRDTAKNMNMLLLQLADHIENLEAENKALREENDRHNGSIDRDN